MTLCEKSLKNIPTAMINYSVILVWLSCFLTAVPTHAQRILYVSDDPAYIANVDTANSLYEQGQYAKAIPYFEKALKITRKSVRTGFRTARSYYLTGREDAAFRELELLMEDHWINFCYDIGLSSFDVSGEHLAVFKDNPRWSRIDSICQAKRAGYTGPLNLELIMELQEILRNDQSIRHRRQDVAKQFGTDSRQHQAVVDSMKIIDSLNLKKVTAIIDQHGYPGKTLVGEQLSYAAFLVVQHANLKTQEKYLPLLRDAAEQGELSKSFLPLMIDRIRVKKDQPQLYGTQFFYNEKGEIDFFPIEDKEGLDKRRAEMGLEPFDDYLKRIGYNKKEGD